MIPEGKPSPHEPILSLRSEIHQAMMREKAFSVVTLRGMHYESNLQKMYTNVFKFGK